MQKCAALGIKPANQLLAVHLGTQTMQFYRGGELVRRLCRLHLAPAAGQCERLAGHAPGAACHRRKNRPRTAAGHGLQGRGCRPAGISASSARRKTADNLITTRILWLRGLEPGVNHGGEVDSHDRYIYIHGTNHEERLGTPQSAGCVLMRNLELVELFDEVRVGDLVWIAE